MYTLQVPALVVNGVTVTQSLPIIEFLEETYKDSPKILPEDPFSRAKVSISLRTFLAAEVAAATLRETCLLQGFLPKIISLGSFLAP